MDLRCLKNCLLAGGRHRSLCNDRVGSLKPGFSMICSRSIVSNSWKACAVSLVLAASAFSQNEELEHLVGRARAAMSKRSGRRRSTSTRRRRTASGQDPLRRFGAQFGAIYYQKGVCEMKLKRWDEAMRSFETCYRDFPNAGTSPDSENPYQIMALCKWGEAAMGAEKWELASGLFAKFIGERTRPRPVPERLVLRQFRRMPIQTGTHRRATRTWK